jgi:hypothetical protein
LLKIIGSSFLFRHCCSGLPVSGITVRQHIKERENVMCHSTFLLSITIIFFLVMNSSNLFSQSTDPFVPLDFNIPEKLETEKFRLRMLTVNDVVKDYDAVMTSIDHLKGVFGPQSKWPTEELTFEQDLIDLGWHQKEFQRRSSFAYTVMNKEESQCLDAVKKWIEKEWPFKNVAYPGREIEWTKW